MGHKLLQVRRDTAANWTSNDPVLSAGEFGYETNTGKLKIGDGSTAWALLTYLIAESGAFSSRVSVVASAVQDTADQIWAPIHFDTESYDILNEFNTGTYKFEPEDTGTYQVTAQVDGMALGAGKFVLVNILKNGAIDLGVQNKFAVNAGDTPRAMITRDIYLLDTDYIEIMGLHNHGSNRNLWGEFLDIHRIA